MAHQSPAQPVKYPYYEATVTETTWHYEAIAYLQQTLSHRYRDRDDVFVGANNFVYWEEGNTEEKQAPDVYICFGVRNIGRTSYKTWEEGGIAPQVVFEVTSKSSRFNDLGTKKAIYEMLGVEEYYAFDPLREYIPRGLRAFRLKGSAYEEITPNLATPNVPLRIYSPRLDLDLEAPLSETGILKLFLPSSGTALRSYREAELAALHEKGRADEAQAQLEGARAQAEEAQGRAERYAQKIKEMGLDPESL